MANVELVRFPNAAALADAAAAQFVANVTVTSAPRTVALSGGRIAKDFFQAVTKLVKTQNASLTHVHFFWADERCVPPTDAESNYRIAAELLFQPLGLPDKNLHRLHGEDEPVRAAEQAARELQAFAATSVGGQPVLDLVLLGMGEDGHVASLFPGESEATMRSSEIYRAVTASKPPPRRLTLGYAALAAAREVWVLASGAGKEAALCESLSSAGQTPLARVLRARGTARVFTELAV